MTPDRVSRVGLTGAGVGTLVAAVALGAAGRVLGIDELTIVGWCALAAVAASWAAVRVAGVDLDVERQVRPRRVIVGDRCIVEMRIHNGRTVARLPLELTDSMSGEVAVRMTLPQRRSDPAATASYHLPARRRGIASFGPIGVRVIDPLGLARVDATFDARVDVIVLPRVVPVGLAAAEGAEDPSGARPSRRAMRTASEEFESLREYAPGDDVRRVHWPSTARLGRPMVRSHEQPTQRRTTVLLDDRLAAFAPGSDDAFDRAVTAAASVLAAARDAGEQVRLLTATGDDSGRFDDPQRFDSVLDQLAATTPSMGGSLAGAIGAAGRGGERIVVCAGVLGDTELSALAGAATNSELVVVECAAAGPVPPMPNTPMLVTYLDGDDLDARWGAAARRAATARGTRHAAVQRTATSTAPGTGASG